MPSTNQTTLIDSITPTTADKGRSDTARLKSAYGSHENSVVKPSPKTRFMTGKGNEEIKVTLTRTEMRNAYENFVKSGKKYIAGSSWPEEKTAVNLSYGTGPDASPSDLSSPPALGKVKPEGEAMPGGMGKEKTNSTIVASGLGPNVNVHGDLKTRKVVDGSTSPSSAVIDPHHANDGKASPHKTSFEIAKSSAVPPADFGHSTGGS